MNDKGEELREDCINFTGYCDLDGYGVLSIQDTRIKAHRIAYKLANPNFNLCEKMCVCHHCDNPSCINPKHLFLGTNDDNIKDRIAKGRNAKEEKHGRAKLTNVQVKEIKELIKSGIGLSHLASNYGVHKTLISQIKRGLVWKSL